ncbi:MAG: hypothetical protein ACJAVI_004257 [Candidatus Azotimanducaceae bacterium]|jgi:hypothetical protein
MSKKICRPISPELDNVSNLTPMFNTILARNEIYAINTVILDLKDVTSTTMANTDTSRVTQWQRELFSILHHPKRDAAAYIAATKLFQTLPENSVVKDAFLKMHVNLSQDHSVNQIGNNNFSDVADLLANLDISALTPLLAEGWREGKLNGGTEE